MCCFSHPVDRSGRPAALGLLYTAPDPELALAALRLHARDGGGLDALAARLRSPTTLQEARAPACEAWRRSGARYDPAVGERLAREDEAGWEGWLAGWCHQPT